MEYFSRNQLLKRETINEMDEDDEDVEWERIRNLQTKRRYLQLAADENVHLIPEHKRGQYIEEFKEPPPYICRALMH